MNKYKAAMENTSQAYNSKFDELVDWADVLKTPIGLIQCQANLQRGMADALIAKAERWAAESRTLAQDELLTSLLELISHEGFTNEPEFKDRELNVKFRQVVNALRLKRDFP